MPGADGSSLLLTPAPLAASGASQAGAVFVDAPAGHSWTVNLAGDWLFPATGSATSGTGPGVFVFGAKTNSGAARSGEVQIHTDGQAKVRTRPLLQQAGVWLQTESNSVLELPWLTVPRVMELGIAAKWIAAQIKKIPEPFTLIALVIVEILVVVLGLTVLTARALVAPLFPEPPTPFPWPPMPSTDPGSTADGSVFPPEITRHIPVTSAVIAMQTVTTAIYLALETLE